MVFDSSALVAILLKEPGHERLLDTLALAGSTSELLVVGAPTLLETTMVLTSRLGQDARPLLSSFLRRLDVQIVAFDTEHFDAAASAFLRFGRGRHPAGLNFGDCLAYSVAAVCGEPLLFIGDDFPQTDIAPAA